VASTQTVLFGTGIDEMLKLGDPAAFAGVLKSWGLGDSPDLAGTDVAWAAITVDTLAIDIEGGGALDYALSNPPTGVRIVLSSDGDGDGGTNLTLYKAAAPAVARLAQAMATLPSAEPASAAHPAETAAGHLALIAVSRA
jgi:hypothetical protein